MTSAGDAADSANANCSAPTRAETETESFQKRWPGGGHTSWEPEALKDVKDIY